MYTIKRILALCDTYPAPMTHFALQKSDVLYITNLLK